MKNAALFYKTTADSAMPAPVEHPQDQKEALYDAAGKRVYI
jgi:hypothetical protein